MVQEEMHREEEEGTKTRAVELGQQGVEQDDMLQRER